MQSTSDHLRGPKNKSLHSKILLYLGLYFYIILYCILSVIEEEYPLKAKLLDSK